MKCWLVAIALSLAYAPSARAESEEAEPPHEAEASLDDPGELEAPRNEDDAESDTEEERAPRNEDDAPSVGDAAVRAPSSKLLHPKKFILLPGIYYRPDTSLGLGGFTQFTFRTSDEARRRATSLPSNVNLSGSYTLLAQYMLKLNSQLYFLRDRLYITTTSEFLHFPMRLYGFGNGAGDEYEIFTDRYVTSEFQGEWLVAKTFYLGGLLRFRKTWILDEAGTGLSYLDGVGQSRDGGFINGLGLSFRSEARDYPFSTLSGHFLSFEVMGYLKGLGSEQRFSTYRFDGRKYFHFGKEHVLAIRGLLFFSLGDVPFYETIPLGKMQTMRGYYEGRFRDDHYLATQIEYRFPIWWRIYGAAFADVGTVFGPSGAFSFKEMQISMGGGLRFRVSDGDRMMIRLDFGVGREGHGFVFAVNEAF